MLKKIFLLTVVLPITTMIILSFFCSTVKAEETPLFIYKEEIIEQLGNEKIAKTQPLEEMKEYENNKKNITIRVVDDKYLDNLLEKRITTPSIGERIEKIMALRISKREKKVPHKELKDYITDIKQQKATTLAERHENLIADKDRYKVKESKLPIAKSIDEYIPKKSTTKPNGRIASLIAEIPFYKANTIETEMSTTSTLFAEKILSTTQEEGVLDSRYTSLLKTIKETPFTTNTSFDEKEIIAQQHATEPQEPKSTNSYSEKGGSSNSAEVTFSITILPVRFVYIENGQIVKIWNNTTENDTEYILKFLDYETNERLMETEQLTIAYFQALQGIDVFEQGIIFKRTTTTFVDNTPSSEIKFNYTSKGVEEVHTFI